MPWVRVYNRSDKYIGDYCVPNIGILSRFLYEPYGSVKDSNISGIVKFRVELRRINGCWENTLVVNGRTRGIKHLENFYKHPD